MLDRKQRVQISDALSDFRPISSGVLQGSCGGPLYFSVFINDLVDEMPPGAEILLFADDSKIYSSDAVTLQNALDRVDKWAKKWQLQLSPTKCQILQIAKHPIYPTYPFHIGTNILEVVSEVRDLGILVASTLKFDLHQRAIIKRASFASYSILKAFVSRRPKAMAEAFATYVRPHLETSPQIWCPVSKSASTTIEAVQRRFTKQVYQKCSIPMVSYQDRLKFLNLESLEVRRKRFDLGFLHKLYHMDSDDLLSRVFPRHCPAREVRRNHRLPENRPHGPRAQFIVHRSAREWNRLPASVVNYSPKQFMEYLISHGDELFN